MVSGLIIVLALGLAPLFLLIGLVQFLKYRDGRRDRRSPLTRSLLRGPGYTLRERLEDVRWDFGVWLALAPVFPLMMYTLVLQQRVDGLPTKAPGVVASIMAALAMLAYAGYRIWSSWTELRKVRLGLEAEMATGEELNRLMPDGYCIFHDVPGESSFNIDHVIVGLTGVYAVETKGRPKRVQEDGDEGHKVYYDGKTLQFPGWRETQPLKQAGLNAEWIAKWLSSAVGERVSVTPLLVLPGWYVTRTAGEGMMVLNEKQVRTQVTRRPAVLTPKQIQQIAHQLDQRCRDIEPKAYANQDS